MEVLPKKAKKNNHQGRSNERQQTLSSQQNSRPQRVEH